MKRHHTDILRLGLPIAIGQLGVIVLGFADTTMVGRYSTDALAAASFVNNIFTLVSFLIMGYSYGLTPIVSSLYGKGLQQEAGGALKVSLSAGSLFFCVLLTLTGGLYFTLDNFGQPATLLPLIRPYYLVILSSMAFVMLFNILRQFTDGLTHTSTGMAVLMMGNALNILGNWLLIYGPGPFPEMGLMGAGIATLVSRVAMVAAMAFVLWKHKAYATYRKGFLGSRLTRASLRKMNSLSLPISIQMGLECAAFTASAVMAGWVGTTSLAAYQVMVTIGTLGFLFYYSFGAGTSIRVANYVGQSDWDNAQRAARAGKHILLGLASLSSFMIFCFARPLIHIFTTDTQVSHIALSLIPLLILYQFADALQICYANVLRGTGRVLSMMRTALISYLAINIPAAYLLGFPMGWGIHGIFLAFSLGLVTAAILFHSTYRKVLRNP